MGKIKKNVILPMIFFFVFLLTTQVTVSAAPIEYYNDSMEGETDSQMETVTETESDEQMNISENGLPVLEYVLVKQPILTIGDIQTIVVGISVDKVKVHQAELVYQNKNSRKQFTVSAKQVGERAIRFDIEDTEVLSGEEFEILGIHLYFDESNLYQPLNIFESPVTYSIVSSENSQGMSTLDDSMLDGENIILSNILDTISGQDIANAIGSDGKDGISTLTTDDVVVVLDPGHDSIHGRGANLATGVVEEDCNLAIALACQNELKRYKGIQVYMTRENKTCPFPGYTSDQCLNQRAVFAKDKNADLLVSIHNNATGLNDGNTTTARGAEIFITNYSKYYDESKEVSELILNELEKIGLVIRNQKIIVKTYPDFGDYDDGKEKDYYAVIRNSSLNGFPGIIIEHAFMNNYEDAQILLNPQKLTEIGQADAKAIVEYYGLTLRADEPQLELSDTELILAVNEEATITGEIYASGTDTITWSTSNEKIFSISPDPFNSNKVVLTGVSNGQATLTARTSGGLTANCKVNVESAKKGIVNTDGLNIRTGPGTVYSRIVSLSEGTYVSILGETKDTYGDIWYKIQIQVNSIKKTGYVHSYYIDLDEGRSDLLNYRVHSQTYGWLMGVGDGEIAGTVGEAKRLEALRIELSDRGPSGNIEYRTHVQTYGWQDWVKNGAVSGTTGESKRLEAVEIRLTGDLAEQYDVYYRVHVQTYGWLGWAKNGEPSGTEGLYRRMEAIQVCMVPKEDDAPVQDGLAFVSASKTKVPEVEYCTHVQTYGWQNWVKNGAVSGTTGESKRLEGICIKVSGGEVSGGITYRTHVQTYGWQSNVDNGSMSGTVGQSKRLEAIQMNLMGQMSNYYDIYYRVHSQTYGWLGWAKNGEKAGSEGLSKRLEGICVKLVLKGQPAPGPTADSFITK